MDCRSIRKYVRRHLRITFGRRGNSELSIEGHGTPVVACIDLCHRDEEEEKVLPATGVNHNVLTAGECHHYMRKYCNLVFASGKERFPWRMRLL
ncbi:unnamed protein product, partial [Iphiclides podalirius]